MKTLLILRHAKSSWKHPEWTDHDRPLNKRGKRDAPCMGKLLRTQGLVPDLIISSTAKRARSTAKIVARKSGYKEEVELTPRFYLASPSEYISVLTRLSDDYERVMVVGHNPGMEELVERLTGELEIMTTAALAQVLLSIDQWSQLDEETAGELAHLWRPKELINFQ